MNIVRKKDRRPKKDDIYIATDNCIFENTIFRCNGIRRVYHDWPSGRRTMDEFVMLVAIVSGKRCSVGEQHDFFLSQVVGSKNVCGWAMLKRISSDNIQLGVL